MGEVRNIPKDQMVAKEEPKEEKRNLPGENRIVRGKVKAAPKEERVDRQRLVLLEAKADARTASEEELAELAKLHDKYGLEKKVTAKVEEVSEETEVDEVSDEETKEGDGDDV